jgi:hypothetical protein
MTDPGQSACEDCGAHTEQVTAFAYGGSGSSRSGEHCARQTVQAVDRAPVMLGHDGRLCQRCWWRRNARRRAAA